ncbi:polysaccharide deacetylase family protein [Anaeromusa acidaminophila]|uniref:polysaccharide deacetylase family protein n=1 Tax=Anaeromusa acidaminophila TaxID=81464 RepID=UPI001FE07DDC|nr:polysaccharide deacetylase family protein [Anaeromusa acidaminophila]
MSKIQIPIQKGVLFIMKPPRFVFSRRAFALSLFSAILLCASFPLITWAIQLWDVPVTAEDPASTLSQSNRSPAIFMLPEHPGDEPLAEEGRPLYDSYLINERLRANLPLNLPTPQPYKAAKVVYLTFDDGPDPQNTPVVLDILKKEQIKATFFLVGTQIEKHPDLVKRLFAEGHAIGNHTYDHIYKNLYQSPQSYVAQLNHTDELLKSILLCRPRISRAPGGSTGSFNKGYWDLLKQNGYIEVGWNVSSGDASAAKAAAIEGNVLTQMKQTFLQSHAIVLMHDGPGHIETVRALPGIIQALKAQGYEFRVVNTQTPAAW